MLACGALVMTLGVQFLMPLGELSPETPGLAARRTRPVVIPPAPAYSAILAAPIFAPNRLPAPGGSGMPGGGPLAGYAALGAATGRAVATGVVAMPGGQVRALHRGDDMEGWRLVDVNSARLTFERKGVRHDLLVGAPAETQTPATGSASAADQ